MGDEDPAVRDGRGRRPRGVDVVRLGRRALRCDALLRELIAAGETIHIVYITGHWLDVDNLEDLSSANAFNESSSTNS